MPQTMTCSNSPRTLSAKERSSPATPIIVSATLSQPSELRMTFWCSSSDFQSAASLRQMRRTASPLSASLSAAAAASVAAPGEIVRRSPMPESSAARFDSIDSTSVSKDPTKASRPSR